MPLAWIALNSVIGLGPVRIKNLVEHFGSPEAVFSSTPEKLSSGRIIPKTCIDQIFSPSLFENARTQLQKSKDFGIEVMTLADRDYPSYLKEIYAPPPVLYIKGNRSVFKNFAIGMVGTRTPTPYGRFAAAKITKELVDNNFVIVSGLAKGVDTASHEACLQQNGLTIAVLGNGIDFIYPKSNEKLSDSICERGALVSEFPLGTPPEAYNFPRRNRIISGLSVGVVVVEAPVKSGSLITAHYALQQGRELFAVPGPINSQMSMGTFNLIRDGANPARCGREIAESLRVMSNPSLFKSNLQCSRAPIEILSDDEQSVFELISSIPVGLDELTEKSGLQIGLLLSILLNLELKGIINQVNGQLFVRN